MLLSSNAPTFRPAELAECRTGLASNTAYLVNRSSLASLLRKEKVTR